jgi:hypothetical protein
VLVVDDQHRAIRSDVAAQLRPCAQVLARGVDERLTCAAGTDGVHRDETDTLWLDGKATKPA